MSKVSYSDVARSTKGKALAAASVSVFEAGTTTLADIYSDVDGTVAANPLTAGSDGLFQFFVDPGLYKYTVSKQGFADFTVDNITIGVAAGYMNVISGLLASPGTRYFGPNSSSAGSGPAGIFTRDGYVRGLRARFGATPGGSDTYVCTLRVGANVAGLADTDITFTIEDPDSTGEDLTNVVEVVAGGVWELKVVNTSSNIQTLSAAVFELIPR